MNFGQNLIQNQVRIDDTNYGHELQEWMYWL
jgi:hypothetical protein